MAHALRLVAILLCSATLALAGYLPTPATIVANQTGQNTLTASQTIYLAVTGANLATNTTDEFVADVRFGRTVLVRNLYCGTGVSQSGNSIAITVRSNHSDTSVTCTISTGTTCNDVYTTTGHSASLGSDLALTYKVVTGTLTGSPTLRCGLEVIAQ